MLWTVLFLSLHAGPVCDDRAEVLAKEGRTRLYIEERSRTPCRGTRERDSVVYRRPDGSVLGTKSIRWRPDQDLPEFDLRMDAPLRRISVKYAGDTALVETDGKAGVEFHRVELPPGTVVDAGIDTWIARNLPSLSGGAHLGLSVLVPEFHRVLTFSVRKIDSDPSRPTEIRIELKPSSWILRALSTPLVVSYDPRTADLKGFEGVSDIKGPDGKNFKVSMRYRGWRERP